MIEDKYLYKYINFKNDSIDAISSILNNILLGYMKFSQPLILNDPNDCQIYINNITHTKSKEFFKSLINKYYFACLSKRSDNITMWTHYSKEHRGICLVYDKSKLISRLLPDMAHGDVSYQSTPKIYDQSFFSDLFAHQQETNVFKEHCLSDMVENVFFKKSLDWLYEKEYRISIEESMIEKLESKELENGYLIKLLPPIEIVLGNDCPKNIIKEIQKITNKQKKPTLIKIAKLDHESYSMKIDPYNITNK